MSPRRFLHILEIRSHLPEKELSALIIQFQLCLSPGSKTLQLCVNHGLNTEPPYKYLPESLRTASRQHCVFLAKSCWIRNSKFLIPDCGASPRCGNLLTINSGSCRVKPTMDAMIYSAQLSFNSETPCRGSTNFRETLPPLALIHSGEVSICSCPALSSMAYCSGVGF